MNLVQIGTNELFPNSFVSPKAKGTYSPARTAARNWRDAIKAQRLLNSSWPSRGDSFPPVLVMEAAEDRASRDVAVLSEGMSIVTFPRQEYRRRFRNPRSEAQMGPLCCAKIPSYFEA
jgi:hypothetical protein